MKTLSRIMAVTALVSVAGCGKLPGASLGGTFLTGPFLGLNIPSEGLDFPAQTYSAALGREYQTLARIAATEDVNWIDASAYMRKGMSALRGEQVQPWAPSVLGLSGEIDSVFQRVISTVNANASRNPVACARVVALYDNYAEELSEGAHSCTDPATVLAELNDALGACGFAVAPPPPPPPPPPAPIPAPLPAPIPAPLPEPIPYTPPAPVVEAEPYNACSAATVPANCTCDGSTGNAILTCERIVDRPVEVIKEVEVVRTVEVPAPVVAPPPYVPAPPPAAPPAAPLPPANYTIYFGYDRYDLTAEARQVIDEAVAAFRAYAAPFMDIIGHTDTRGSKSYNTRLAQRRADAVAGAVASRGVDRSALRVSASSELDPAVTTGDGVREALNRRVTISIVQ